MKRLFLILIIILSLSLTSCFIPNYDNDEVKEHTHTFDMEAYDGSYHFMQCSYEGCKERINEEIHKYSDWTVITENTHDTNGVTEIHCTECDYQIIGSIPAGHCVEYIETKPSTCLEDGYSGHYKCKECGALFKDEMMKEPLAESNIRLSKSSHSYENAKIAYFEPTMEENGRIEIRCSMCNTVESDKYVIILSNDTSDTSNQPMGSKDATCEEDGYIKLKALRNRTIFKLNDVLEDYTDELAILDEMGAFEVKTFVIPKTGHSYRLSIGSSTYERTGYTTISCSTCRRYVDYKGDYIRCPIDVYNKENTELFEEISATTSCLDGMVRYKIKKEGLLPILIEYYDLPREELERLVDEANLSDHGFQNMVDEHDYQPVYIVPTTTEKGAFHIECTVCKKKLAHQMDGYLESIDIPVISTTSEYYNLASTTFRCTEDGERVFEFTEEFYSHYLKNTAKLGLSDEEIEKHCGVLREPIKIPIPASGHSYKKESLQLCFPTYDNEGYMSLDCLRDGCDTLYVGINGETRLILPKVNGNSSYYNSISVEYVCYDYGSNVVSIKEAAFKEDLKAFTEDFYYTFLNNAEILAEFTVQTPKLTTHFGGYGDNLRVDDSKVLSEGIATIYCRYCENKILDVQPLPRDEEHFTLITSLGNCIQRTQYYYRMTKEAWLPLIEGKEELLNDRLDTYEIVASHLSIFTIYSEEGNAVPDNHVEYERVGEFTKPSYNKATGVATSGYYTKRCVFCGPSSEVEVEVKYSDGEWSQGLEGYRRKYTIVDAIVFGEEQTTWSMCIRLGSGVSMDTSNISLYNEAPVDTQKSVRIRSDYFDVDGEYKRAKDLAIYIDGQYYDNEQLIAEGRLEVVELSSFTAWYIYLGQGANGETLLGDVCVWPVF